MLDGIGVAVAETDPLEQTESAPTGLVGLVAFLRRRRLQGEVVAPVGAVAFPSSPPPSSRVDRLKIEAENKPWLERVFDVIEMEATPDDDTDDSGALQKALDKVAARIKSIRETHGKSAVGVYLGNPNVHNWGAMLFGSIGSLVTVSATGSSISRPSASSVYLRCQKSSRALASSGIRRVFPGCPGRPLTSLEEIFKMRLQQTLIQGFIWGALSKRMSKLLLCNLIGS